MNYRNQAWLLSGSETEIREDHPGRAESQEQNFKGHLGMTLVPAAFCPCKILWEMEFQE